MHVIRIMPRKGLLTPALQPNTSARVCTRYNLLPPKSADKYVRNELADFQIAGAAAILVVTVFCATGMMRHACILGKCLATDRYLSRGGTVDAAVLPGSPALPSESR